MQRDTKLPLTAMPAEKTRPHAPDAASPEDRLARLGITLPTPAAPVASYVPVVEASGFAYVSGQLPFQGEQVMVGRVGDDRDPAFGQDAARACCVMVLAQLKAALGSLDRVERIVKLNVFVNSDGRFTGQPQVANGASDLMIEVFGDAGRHARAAVGVPTLPLGAVVEVDAVVAVKPN
jgi:enamine deaminase RidA (YjgF/YER057c/UK114 family)